MRVFIRNHNASPEQSVREAVNILSKAGIYSTDGGTIGGRGLYPGRCGVPRKGHYDAEQSGSLDRYRLSRQVRGIARFGCCHFV
jgi:hypothetical protein